MRVYGHARDVDRRTEVVRDRRVSLDGAATEDAECLEPHTERLATLYQRRDPPAKLALEAALRYARSSHAARHAEVVLLVLGRRSRSVAAFPGKSFDQALHPPKQARERGVVEPQPVHVAKAGVEAMQSPGMSCDGGLGARRPTGRETEHRDQADERSRAAKVQADHSGGSFREA